VAVVDGSDSRRSAPRTVTVRAQRVKVATTPRSSETTVRSGDVSLLNTDLPRRAGQPGQRVRRAAARVLHLGSSRGEARQPKAGDSDEHGARQRAPSCRSHSDTPSWPRPPSAPGLRPPPLPSRDGVLRLRPGRTGTVSLRWEHTEGHWALMDRYAPGLIARGPTLTDDGAERHRQHAHDGAAPPPGGPCIRLRRAALRRRGLQRRPAAKVEQRPRAHHVAVLQQWDRPRFLVLGHGQVPTTDISADLHHRQSRYLSGREADELIAHGPLLTQDTSRWLGTATLVELPDRAAAAAMLSDGDTPKPVSTTGWRCTAGASAADRLLTRPVRGGADGHRAALRTRPRPRAARHRPSPHAQGRPDPRTRGWIRP
jgi:uncharacterized protein